jgi:hypothetical protein
VRTARGDEEREEPSAQLPASSVPACATPSQDQLERSDRSRRIQSRPSARRRSGRPPPPATTAHQTLLLRSPPTRRLVAICKGATILRLAHDCAGARADDAGLAASGRAPALASGRVSRRPRRGPSPARKPRLVPTGSAMAFDCGSSVGRVRESVRGSDRGVRLHCKRGPLRLSLAGSGRGWPPGFSSWAAPATCGAPGGPLDSTRDLRLVTRAVYRLPRRSQTVGLAVASFERTSTSGASGLCGCGIAPRLAVQHHIVRVALEKDRRDSRTSHMSSAYCGVPRWDRPRRPRCSHLYNEPPAARSCLTLLAGTIHGRRRDREPAWQPSSPTCWSVEAIPTPSRRRTAQRSANTLTAERQ